MEMRENRVPGPFRCIINDYACTVNLVLTRMLGVWEILVNRMFWDMEMFPEILSVPFVAIETHSFN